MSENEPANSDVETEAQRVNKAGVQALGMLMGMSKADLENDEIREELEKVVASGGIDTSNNENFVDFWDGAGFLKGPRTDIENHRARRYEDLDFMVANSVEVALALRAYVDECLSAIWDESQGFYQVEVQRVDGTTDREKTTFVNNLLQRGGFFQNPRLRCQQLSLYGDAWWRIKEIRKATKKEIEDGLATDEWMLEGYTLDDPLFGRRFNLPNKDVAWKYQEAPLYGRGKKMIDVAPWDMVHMRLSTARKDIRPYGEALLEASRSSYKRLLILEALLALTRASRVERLLLKIPTNTENPDLMITKLIRFKNLMKSIILGNAGGLSTEKKNIAFTDIMYLPKGKDQQSSFEMDRLTASMDLSSIEDVEYFQDKVINGLNMPRGYLKSDDAYAGYRKLALQDLRLSRTINNVFRAEAEGTAMVSKVILYRTDKWEEGMVVVVNYTPPAPIASEQLGAIREALDLIEQIILMTGEVDPETAEPIKDMEMIRELMIKLAHFPSKIVDLIIPQVPDEETVDEAFRDQAMDKTKKKNKKKKKAKKKKKGKGKAKPIYEESITIETLKKRAVLAFAASASEQVRSDDMQFIAIPMDKVPKRAPTNETVIEELMSKVVT